MPDAARPIGVVISTLGRAEPLEALLDSLLLQTFSGFAVSLCVQGNLDGVERMLARRTDFAALSVTTVTSGRGLSLGRNTAARQLPDSVEYLVFPNDTTTYPPTLFAGLVESMTGHGAGTMSVVDEFGPKFVFLDEGPLTRRNVWNVISPGLVMSADSFGALGGFDETLGTGASSPWQSGEETDLVMRYLERQPQRSFAWMPQLRVGGVADSTALSVAERRRKLRAYGRGLGRVLVLHRFSVLTCASTLLGGILFGVRHRPAFSTADGWWVFIGRLEGLLGRTIGSTTAHAAVER